MSTNWSPDLNGLNEIINTLHASRAPDNSIQQNSYEKIVIYSKNPEFAQYLLYILYGQISIEPEIRQIAGLLLKKSIHTSYHELPKDIQLYIRNNILNILNDPELSIRRVTGTIITTIVSSLNNLDEWNDLIPNLISLIENNTTNNHILSGSFNALRKICEDSSDKLINAISKPLNKLIPLLLHYLQHSNELYRIDSLICINQLLIDLPPSLVLHMSTFIQLLSILTQDNNKEIRKLICQSIVIFLDVGIEYLIPHLTSIIQFIIEATKDTNENVVLEACEFFSTFCELHNFDELKDIIKPFLIDIIPLLLTKMVYSKDDIQIYENEQNEQDENVPDRPEEIKPIFHKIKDNSNKQIEDDDEDNDQDQDNDDIDDPSNEWNVRKSAAAGLDILSHNYGLMVLPILLPLLQERLSATNAHWSIRESGILALGAIAEGCEEGILPHLPQLFPYLLLTMNDDFPLIRSISCWTLSRYTKWIVNLSEHDIALKPYLEALLKCILDKNKKVQEAACSAFCILEENAEIELLPYLYDILNTLMFAFRHKYQAKNLLILYDAIGTLADSFTGTDHLNNKDYINMLMPPLIEKWNSLPDSSRELFPLLETLSAIALALRTGFQDFAPPVLFRSLRLIENGLLSLATGTNNFSDTAFDPNDCAEFIVCSLDLISGLIEGLGVHFLNLLMASEENKNKFLPLIFECVQIHHLPDIRQSALAVIGDLSKVSFTILAPYVNDIIPLLLKNCENPDTYLSLCNNAIWALGEIAIHSTTTIIEPFVQNSMKILTYLIKKNKIPRYLSENCAITIGRFGLICPAQVSLFVPDFFRQWCSILRDIKDPLDREHCFFGFCSLIKANPNGVMNDFMYICGAIGSFHFKNGEENLEVTTYEASNQLKNMFKEILISFKNSLGNLENWNKYISNFPPALTHQLQMLYQI